MRSQNILSPCVLAVLLGWSVEANSQDQAARTARPARPNVIVILIDDLGWTDLGCCGSKFYETPHIDGLARDGMRFTDAYAACNCCSPTRASVMTGKYPARLHLTDWIPGWSNRHGKLRPPDWTQHLPLVEVTLAEALGEAGYVTASLGKWHLGGGKHLPQSQGFDLNFAGGKPGAPRSYFWPYGVPAVASGAEGEYLTDRTSDETIKFIEAHRRQPFFIYLAHYAVHTPLAAKAELIRKYRAKPAAAGPHTNPTYAAMIDSVDQGVGRIMGKLESLGIAERTIIVFSSDNGGLAPRATSNVPLRSGKGNPWEGGVRVPLIVRWPGVVAPGSVCRVPVVSTDFYPTILEATGVAGDKQHNAQVDGLSLVPLLKRTGTPAREAIYWHYPHYNILGGTPHGAIRQGDWKLIEFYEDDRLELYDLGEDLGEAENLAAKMPDRARALREKLHQWRRSIGAQMPLPNPEYDPARLDQRKGPRK